MRQDMSVDLLWHALREHDGINLGANILGTLATVACPTIHELVLAHSATGEVVGGGGYLDLVINSSSGVYADVD